MPRETNNLPFDTTKPASEMEFTAHDTSGEPEQSSPIKSKRWFFDPQKIETDKATDIYDLELDRLGIAKKTADNLHDCVQVAKAMDSISRQTYVVPKVHTIVEDDKAYWIVMEKVNGPTLTEQITEGEGVDEQSLLFILHEVSETCRIMEENNLLHNDLAGRNIILDEKHNYYPRLIDYDLMLKMEETEGKVHHTPVNPKAELFQHEVFQRSNVRMSVNSLISTFEDEVSSFPEGESKNHLKSVLFQISHQTQPKDFSQLSQATRYALGVNVEEMNEIRNNYFM